MYLFLNPTHQHFFTLALINKNGQILVYKKIKAEYRQAEKLLIEIDKIVGAKNLLTKLKGLIVVSGPGGFTSLRIGLATANALAWSLQIPIIGLESKYTMQDEEEIFEQSFKENDEKMIKIGFNKFKKVKTFKQVLPKYGSEPHITLKNK
ncbi:MAG TPA: hypothetical protein PLK76_03415 [bacterium]|nr:hypothetical protein [bacterium]